TTADAGYAANPVLNWKWVRVMPKINKSMTGAGRITSVDGTTSGTRICWKGTNEVATAGTCDLINAKPVYELTALAVTTSGSRRMIQYEISQTALPNMPGALVFDGPVITQPQFGAPNSNVFRVNGNDSHSGPNGTCSTPVTNSAGLGGFDASSDATLTG